MAAMRPWLALSAVAVLAGGCQILNYTWVTPATVAPGRVFTMEVSGQNDGLWGPAGAVFQVPNGFTVLGASAVVTGAPSTPFTLERDDPALLALYTPDANHHLTSFSGFSGPQVPFNDVVLRVYVRAPGTPGAYQLEMALAAVSNSTGLYVPQLGLGSFQAANGSVVRPLQVIATPAPPPFALAAALVDPVHQSASLETADIDGDGRDDLVQFASNSFASNSFSVWRSVPGGFAPPVAVPVPGPVSDGAIADFDGDGFADVALSTGTVMFGDGGATWTPVVAFPTAVTWVGAGDVDGDGLGDIVGGSNAGLVVARGQANRTFVSWSTGLPTSGLEYPSVVDLDADGRAEVVTFDGIAQGVYRSTTLGVWNLVGGFASTRDVLAIDLDSNGTKELVSGSGQVFAYTPSGLVLFGAVPVHSFTRAAVLDFDRDGRDDIAVAPSPPPGFAPKRLELWRNLGGGSLQLVPLPPTVGFEALHGFATLIAADFDEDTFPDLAALTDFVPAVPNVPVRHNTMVLAWQNTQHGGVAAFGDPCGAPGFASPDLSVQGSILPGQSGVLQLANAAPSGTTLMWLGSSRTLWNGQPLLPLDLGIFGASGCTLLAEPLAIVGVMANASGVASLPFTVPLYPPAAEVALFVQGAVLAPAANPLGAVFSRGLALKIQ